MNARVNDDDREIARLLHDADPAKNGLGAELVVRKYELACLRAAVRGVSDAGEARDIVHEVMATFIERETDPVRASFEEGRSIEAYLIAMMHHRVHDYFRQRKREQEQLSTAPQELLSTMSSNEIHALDRLIVGEQRAIVQTCVAKLPPDELRLLTLYYGEDSARTQQAIADELGVVVSTINYRLKQALRHLRQLLEESGVRGVFHAGHE